MPVVMPAPDQIRRRIAGLVVLLADAIDSGASVGYVHPAGKPDLEACWDAIATDVENHARTAFAVLDQDRVMGSVQLAPSSTFYWKRLA